MKTSLILIFSSLALLFILQWLAAWLRRARLRAMAERQAALRAKGSVVDLESAP